jgi:hypothetical protein
MQHRINETCLLHRVSYLRSRRTSSPAFDLPPILWSWVSRVLGRQRGCRCLKVPARSPLSGDRSRSIGDARAATGRCVLHERGDDLQLAEQEKIDRGEIDGKSTDQALELTAAKHRIRQLETELALSRKVNEVFLSEGLAPALPGAPARLVGLLSPSLGREPA